MWNEIHRTFDNHSLGIECQFKDWKLVNSRRRGLLTQLFFKCQMCNYEDNIWSEPAKAETLDVNTAAVAGTVTVGIGYAQLEELCAAVNIPCMSEKTYINYRESLVDDFQETAMQSMKMAGEVEKQLAIERNDIINGIPYITVVADGSWMKRSYGTAYDSPSGIGAIIGYRTGKVLFVGIRNKYCTVCDMAMRQGVEARKHKCYRNYDRNATSTSMESDAIVEGFKSSLEMHGLIYKILIADGDSNVYQSIINNAPYGEMNIVVQKIECTNHLLRNLCKKLKAVANTTQPQMHRKRNVVQLRNIVKNNILKIRREVLQLATVQRGKRQPHHVKATELQKAILNIPSHMFGEHRRCEELCICRDKCEAITTNYVPYLKLYGLYDKIENAVRYLSAYSDSLLLNLTNNPAESFNSIICVEIGSKRINFGKRGSYNARVAGSVVQYNTQQVLTQVHEHMCKNVPVVVSSLEKRRQIKVSRTKESRQVHGREKRFKQERGTDCFYGPNSQKPDLPPQVLEQLRQNHSEKLLENAKNRNEIERETTGQCDCELWQSLRRQMLTASNFGVVCRMRPTTSCASIVKNILFPPSIETAAVIYGRTMEKVAREQLAEKLQQEIKPCGLFIDYKNPYLGASPDGLIDDDGLVEIKCPSSAENLTAEEAIEKLPQLKTVFDKKNTDKMNRKHRFFYQVQGQLNITQRDYCIFTVWTPKSLKTVHVDRDDVFWETQMLPFLTRFYHECMLPEILDSRYNRHMPIRNPQYIMEAKEARETQNSRQVQVQIPKNRKFVEEVVSTTSSSVATPTTDHDDDCIMISYNKQNMTEEDAIKKRKVLDNTSTPLSVLQQNILPVHSELNDESLDAFLRVIRNTSDFDTQSVQYIEFPELIIASNKSVQIIGGNCTHHWRCIFFDGSKLHMYDSIPGCTYNKLAEKEKNYIRLRFPKINVNNIIFEKVQRQPDNTSSGVYAAAFATSIVLGKNPCDEKYTNNVACMRRHFLSILENNELTSFPTL